MGTLFNKHQESVLTKLGFAGGNVSLSESLSNFGIIAHNRSGTMVVTKTVGVGVPQYVVVCCGSDMKDNLWVRIANRTLSHNSECTFEEGGALVDSGGDVITKDTELYELMRLFEVDCVNEHEFQSAIGVNDSHYKEMSGDDLFDAILDKFK